MRPRYLPALLVLLTLLGGCQSASKRATFVGFTFGGGGNTFNCEPAIWNPGAQGFTLEGGASGATSIVLSGALAVVPGEPAPLTSAKIKVIGYEGVSTLISGSLVLQSQDGPVAHGSFDLKAKLPDGREFPIVGSFTAKAPEVAVP